MLLKIGLALCGVMMLSACNMPFASNDKDQYLEARNAPDLVIEKPLTTSNLSGFYKLPPAPKNPKVDILPPVS